jgi:GT2 family glycosyltransferase
VARPRISALIVSFNTRHLLLQSIASAIREPDVEVVVVDNASSDGSADAVEHEYPRVRLVRSQTNLGMAGGTNAAACVASGQDLLLLNPDAALTPGALDGMVRLLNAQPRAAAVGPALVYPSGAPQSSAFRFPGLVQVALDLFPVNRLMDTRLNGRIHGRAPRLVDYVLGACMLIRREAWDRIGPLDEGYFMYLEEVDWCRRALRQGWQVWYEPRTKVIHHGGAATSQQPEKMFTQLWRSRLRYYERFHGPLHNRLVRGLVRLGMRAAARRDNAGRRRAAVAIRQLTA